MNTLDILCRAAFLAAFVPSARSQCAGPDLLAASNAQHGQDGGCAVAIDGGRAVMGVRKASPGGLAWAGAVGVFELQAGQWVETAQLIAADAVPQAQFGSAVALEGDRVIVGAYQDPHAGLAGVGSVYVFELGAGAWVQMDKVIASDAAENAFFGTAVALSGGRFLVGAPQAAVGQEDNAGQAYVFRFSTGRWVEEARLVASSASALDLFGRSVALDGDRAAVGAYGEDQGNTLGVGAAFVFDRSGASWNESAALFASDGAPYDRLGFSVALDGDRLLCGAPERDASGVAKAGAGYVFELVGATWSESAILVDPSVGAGDGLGFSVALADDLALLASPTVDAGRSAPDVGAARVFERDGGGWTPGLALTDQDAHSMDRLGWSADIDGGLAVIGAIAGDAPGAMNSGTALVFALAPCVTSYCACDSAPCGNLDPTAGCANSTGSGARLELVDGSPSVAADDLILGAVNVLPNQPGLFFQGDQAINGGAGVLFGDGLRCAGSNVIRLQTTTPGPGGTTQTSISIATKGNVVPGDVRRYQYWYRDPSGSPCNQLFNLTNALEIDWLP